MTMPLVNITPLGRLTLDELWREAESLGFVRVWTNSSAYTNVRTGYDACGNHARMDADRGASLERQE